MYLSKNDNVWVNACGKDWNRFSNCKNFIGKSNNFYGTSHIFGGKFHKEEKLVAEIVGGNIKHYLRTDEREFRMKKSKNYKKTRKQTESLKKRSVKKNKGKVIKQSKNIIKFLI